MMNTPQAPQITLHDIKPIVEIDEYSLYYLIASGLVIAVLLAVGGWFIYRWMIRKNAINIRAVHLKKIDNLLLSNTKDTAYALSHLGATFKDDTPQHLQSYEQLMKHLENFKYKKEVDKFDEETLHCIELYKGLLSV